MKKLLLTSFVLAAFLSVAEAAETAAPEPEKAPQTTASSIVEVPFYHVGRGVFTIAESPVELCRNIWLAWIVPYAEHGPLAGTGILPFSTVIGVCEGTLSVLYFTLAGCTDILMPCCSDTLCSLRISPPPFVWESPWTVKQLQEQKASEKRGDAGESKSK